MCGKKKEPSLSKYLGIRKAAYKGAKTLDLLYISCLFYKIDCE